MASVSIQKLKVRLGTQTNPQFMDHRFIALQIELISPSFLIIAPTYMNVAIMIAIFS